MSLYQAECEIKISFEDLDPIKVVWHGNYMRYMERARCDMLAKLKYNYWNMLEDNVAYPIAKMKVKYIKPATLDDVLLVKTEILTIEPSLNIKYTMFNKETGDKIFEATTMQICVDTSKMETVYTAPKGLHEEIEKASNEKN